MLLRITDDARIVLFKFFVKIDCELYISNEHLVHLTAKINNYLLYHLILKLLAELLQIQKKTFIANISNLSKKRSYKSTRRIYSAWAGSKLFFTTRYSGTRRQFLFYI